LTFCARYNYFYHVGFSLPVRWEGFSMDLPLPVWWEIILISFVELMNPENIGTAVEISFQLKLDVLLNCETIQ